MVEHVRWVLAIEGMVAAQGLDLRAPLKPAPGVAAAQKCIRTRVPKLDGDRTLHVDIEATRDLLAEGSLEAAVVEVVGTLA